MSEEYTYTFYGRLMPERAHISLDGQIPLKTDFGDGSLSIYASQITVTVNTTEPEDEINLFTLRNAVKNGVHSLTDILAYSHGHSYDVEITSVVTPNNYRRTFGVQVDALADKVDDDSRLKVFNKAAQLYEVSGGSNLRRCMKNLRLAKDDPLDTGLYCYRAIESIRKHFHEEYDIPDTNDGRIEAWERLRTELDVQREDIDLVKEYADEPRHGGTVDITGEERAEVFSHTWDIINDYVSYLRLKNDEDT